MDVRELEQRQYNQRLRTVIVGTEGLHAQVQDVGDARATIGWGYTLNRNNNVEIWTRSGLELSTAQRETLERVDRAPPRDKTRIGLGLDRAVNEAESDRLFRASIQEYEVHAERAGLPLSHERVALVSVTYNRGVGAMRGHPVFDAIGAGNRYEAWYQLRYNCWGSREDMEGGLRKRRFAESEVFGLYDDRANVSVEEAAEVYAMYRTYHAEIDRVERGFGVSIDGQQARPNRIAQANRDYPEIVHGYGAVRSISESLAPARTVLIDHLRARYPEQATGFTEARFNAGQIDLDRYPIDGDRSAGERTSATRPHDAGSASRATAGSQFDDPFLNRLFGAVSAGDSASARDIALVFAQSPRGESFLELGRQRLAQQERQTPEAADQMVGPD